MIGLVASVGVLPSIAIAGGRHGDDGPTVRDHRSSDSGSHDAPTVRDHRSSDSGSHDAPTVRDHRSSDSGSHDAPTVRDHRGDDGGRRDDVYFVSSGEDVAVTDGGSPGLFDHVSGPTWIIEAGGFAHRFRGPSLARRGSVETVDGSMADYGLSSGTAAEGDTAAGAFEMRFIVPATDHYYAGVELGIGALTRSPIKLMSEQAADIHISSRTLIAPNAVFGVRARHGIAELDAELAGGLRIVSATVQSRGAGEDDPSENESVLTGVIEARLRGVLWVAPHVFLAAQGGVGVLDRNDVNVGLSIGLSSRPYGQTR